MTVNFVMLSYTFDVACVDKCTCTKLPAADSSQVPFPVGRRGHTAVLYGNSMYIYGGYVDMKGSSGELWQFNFGVFVLLQVNYVM